MPLTTELPLAGYMANAGRTQAEMKDALESFLAAARETVGLGGAWSTLTLAGGAIAPTLGEHLVDTEAAGATDDLTNIGQATLEDGRLLILRSASATRAVIVKHAAGGVGQISIADGLDLSLVSPSMFLVLRRNGALWEEIVRSFGNQAAGWRTRNGLSVLPVARGVDLVSAATLALGADGDFFHVTGATGPVTALSAKPVGTVVRVVFEGTPTLAHSAVLILANAENFTARAGDTMQFVSEGVGVWREQGRSGSPLGVISEYGTPGSFTWLRNAATKVLITMVGGGGGGGIGANPGGAGGGGAGECIWRILMNVSSDLTVVVGSGGLSSAPGQPSTVTGTGVALTAVGGLPGGHGSVGAGGAGGGARGGAGGEVSVVGVAGDAEGSVAQGGGGGGGGGGPAGIVGRAGAATPAFPGGAGGAGFTGGGGAASLFAVGGAGGATGAGSPGARGSGGGGGTGFNQAGGQGGAGFVRIEVVATT